MKNKEKIIYINGRFLTQDITGVQRYAIEVVKQLDKVESKYQFVILTPKTENMQNLELRNIKIVQTGKLSGHFWEQVSLPMYILRKNRKAKLISLCNLAPILKPSYVVIHDINFKTHPEHLDKKFAIWYRIITRLNINRYKHIFTVSNFSKKEIVEEYKIKEEKITVTYNSAEHFDNIEINENIIKRLELNNKEFCFSLGSKSPHKNHQYVVECAIKNPDMLFVISGKSNSKVFKDENDQNGIKNIIYTGYLQDSELKALYKNCKAFIFPSLYEGFGIPPLEAIESGCKNIILSDILVFREIYGDVASYIDLNENDNYNIENILKNKNININESDIEELNNKYKWINVAKAIKERLEK